MKLKNRRDALNKMLYKELKDDEWITRELDEMIGTSDTEETRRERYDYFCRYQATAYVMHFRRVLATEGKRLSMKELFKSYDAWFKKDRIEHPERHIALAA